MDDAKIVQVSYFNSDMGHLGTVKNIVSEAELCVLIIKKQKEYNSKYSEKKKKRSRLV